MCAAGVFPVLVAKARIRLRQVADQSSFTPSLPGFAFQKSTKPKASEFISASEHPCSEAICRSAAEGFQSGGILEARSFLFSSFIEALLKKERASFGIPPDSTGIPPESFFNRFRFRSYSRLFSSAFSTGIPPEEAHCSAVSTAKMITSCATPVANIFETMEAIGVTRRIASSGS